MKNEKVRLSLPLLVEKQMQILPILQGNEKMLAGLKFTLEAIQNGQDYESYKGDEFTAEIVFCYVKDLEALIMNNRPQILNPEDKGYSGNKFEGKLYQATRNMSCKELAILMREELKAEFPGQKISVKSDYNSIDIVVKEIRFNPFSAEFIKLFAAGCSFDEINRELSNGERYNEEYRQMMKKLERIHDQYNMDDSNSQVDYFHRNYYGGCRIQTDHYYEQINPQHSEVIRKKEYEAKEVIYQLKLKEKKQEKKQEYGAIFPKYGLCQVSFVARRGEEPKAYNAMVLKSINPAGGHKFYLGNYDLRYKGLLENFSENPRGGNYKCVSPYKVIAYPGIESMSLEEYIRIFRFIEPMQDETFDKYYKEKVLKAYSIQKSQSQDKPVNA